MPKGSLKVSQAALPLTSPSYPTQEPFSFNDITLVTISYRVAVDQVAHLVPDALELEDEPLITSTFVEYGMSTVGAYSEFVQTIEVMYKGKVFDYTLILILDNESAIFAGRELYGYPKVFGKIDLQLKNQGRLISGSAERPVGRKIAEFDFIPEKLLAGLPQSQKRILNLRTIPSPILGVAPSINQFLSIEMNMKSPEVWVGSGSVNFPRKSVMDRWADFDILRYEGAVLARHATGNLSVFEE